MINLEAYNRKCKSSVGGIKNIYLTRHDANNRHLKSVVDGVLTLHPQQVVYKFDTLTGASFIEREENGRFTQSLNFSFSFLGDYNVQSITKCFNLAIIEDNNGLFHYIGLYNGLTGTTNKQTGASKQELTGYQINLDGVEIISAPYTNEMYMSQVNKGMFLSSSSSFASSSRLVSNILNNN